MTQPGQTPTQDSLPDYPPNWTLEELIDRWNSLLVSILKEEQSTLPLKRAQTQVRQEVLYQNIMHRWPRMTADEKLAAWKGIIRLSEDAIRKVLPTCVACGECCRRGSPSLHQEDLELLREGHIPWRDLVTLRRGEPVRSPFQETILQLESETVKVREKPGTRECLFFEGEADQCRIYANRPTQCRAQACWDPKAALELKKVPCLTRLEIFEGVELLLDLMEQHDRRCSFEKLAKAFDRLRETRGESVAEVLQLLSYEDHFRKFLGSQLNIPDENLDLVFGRSFTDLVPLFGFKVITDTDGSRCLVPDIHDDQGPVHP